MKDGVGRAANARLFVALLAGASLFVSCQQISTGNTMTAQPLDLQKQLDDAVAQGRNCLTLAPGRYQVSSAIKLKGTDDFTIDGHRATVVFPPDGEMFVFSGCKQITVKGVTVDCDPLPFTQGTIVTVADDHLSFEYELHPGYPVHGSPGGGITRRSGVFVFDSRKLHWRQDVPDLYPSASEILSPTRGRITLGDKLPGNAHIQVGDYVAFKNPRGNAFLFRDCGTVTLEDVTVLTAPTGGFLLRACFGPVVARRCVITRGPKPAGATHERLLSSVADGFNLAYSRHGVTMEDCDFSYMGDDSVNLHGAFVKVVAVDSPTSFWVARPGSTEFMSVSRPGDEVRILARDSFAVKAAASLVNSAVAAPPPGIDEQVRKDWKLAPATKLFFIRFVLAAPVVVEAGDHLEIPAVACPNFVFRNNYFHDHRARGLRLGASHGLIEGNRFERIKSTAISLGPHAVTTEGGWVQDVTVRNNRFHDVCFDDRTIAAGGYNAGAIVVQHYLPDPAVPYVQENTDIRILDNTIDTVGGAGILATSAKGLTIRGNHITQSHQRDCDRVGTALRLSARGAVSINYCTDVSMEGNHFGARGPYCRQDVAVHPEKGSP